MDWLTFIVEITKAISWPIAIVIAVLIFKDPLLKLLRELKRLKWKDVEVEFDKEVKKAKAELPETQRVTASEKYKDQYDEFIRLRLLETSPKAAVLEAWLQVEKEVYKLLKDKDVAVPPKFSPIRLLDLLLKHKLIDKDGQNLFNTIRKLRNSAVHEYENVISENAALDYLDMTSEMIRILRSE